MNRLAIPVGPADHAQGPADAPVTLVEYGDFECPHCGQAYPILQEVQRAMGSRLRFVFRNFPLAEAHPHAVQAAAFAEAAADVGKFWDAHDLLFEHQHALSAESLVSYGRRIGLDAAAVQAAIDGRFDERITHDFAGGVRSGVNGTPTLFINGIRYDGSRDVESLLEALNEA